MELGLIKMTFTPSGRINTVEFHRINLEGLPDIKPIRSSTNENDVADMAKACLSDYFALVNRAEKEKIVSVSYNIKRYANGIIKAACVRFSLEQVNKFGSDVTMT